MNRASLLSSYLRSASPAVTLHLLAILSIPVRVKGLTFTAEKEDKKEEEEEEER